MSPDPLPLAQRVWPVRLAKECPTPHDSVEQRCTNHSNHVNTVMPLFGSQFTEATQVYNYYCSDCPIWSMTERSKFLVRTSLFSIVGHSLRRLWAPAYTYTTNWCAHIPSHRLRLYSVHTLRLPAHVHTRHISLSASTHSLDSYCTVCQNHYRLSLVQYVY